MIKYLFLFFIFLVTKHSVWAIKDLRTLGEVPLPTTEVLIEGQVPDIIPELDEENINIVYANLPLSSENLVSKLENRKFVWIKDQSGTSHCYFVKFKSRIPRNFRLYVPLIWGNSGRDYFSDFNDNKHDILSPLNPNLSRSDQFLTFSPCVFKSKDTFPDQFDLNNCKFGNQQDHCEKAYPKDADGNFITEDSLGNPIDRPSIAENAPSNYGKYEGIRRCYFQAQGNFSEKYEMNFTAPTDLCPKGKRYATGVPGGWASYNLTSGTPVNRFEEIRTGLIYKLCRGVCGAPAPVPSGSGSGSGSSSSAPGLGNGASSSGSSSGRGSSSRNSPPVDIETRNPIKGNGLDGGGMSGFGIPSR